MLRRHASFSSFLQPLLLLPLAAERGPSVRLAATERPGAAVGQPPHSVSSVFQQSNGGGGAKEKTPDTMQ